MEWVLRVVDLPEVVWNQTAEACPGLNVFGHIGEQPDSLPVAWHNPLTNISSLISATSWGTFASRGRRLDQPLRHVCTHEVYKAANESSPQSYANHQWLQAPRVWANGSGFALVHNEFHGEQPPHNKTYCSFLTKTSNGNCIEWSTDLAATQDGGDTWHMTHAPLFTLPRQYNKDEPIAGYGALGAILFDNGYYYGYVARSYHENTGAGPAGTKGNGTCLWRTRDPTDASVYRGWNGSAWGTEWVDPYRVDIRPADLWRYTCAAVKVPSAATVGHLSPRKFARTAGGRQSWPSGWASHVLLGWPEGRSNQVSYSLMRGELGPSLAEWPEMRSLDISGWLNPHTIGGLGKLMYPQLIDHESPFYLTYDQQLPEPDELDISDGLSYGLVGNQSLYLYWVVARKYWVRVRLAWVPATAASPPEPFPPLAPLSASCASVRVTGAGLEGVDGVYQATTSHQYFTKDAMHALYQYGGHWTLAHHGVEVYYQAIASSASKSGKEGPPAEGWGEGSSLMPFPVLACAD